MCITPLLCAGVRSLSVYIAIYIHTCVFAPLLQV